ncbi:MAG: helix-turn-helix transcriptional regulator [Candidatus Baltobacteraceae bacterium]
MAGKRFGKARPSGVPNNATERKIRVLLELIRNRFVRLSSLAADYETSERSVLRDLQDLRAIGGRAGFRLSEKTENGQIRLLDFDARPTAIDKNAKALQSLIKDAAHALGEPVAQELETLTPHDERSGRRFLRFMLPMLREGTQAAETFKALQSAWAAHARVRFRYGTKPAQREVEPYAVLHHAGRYYLLGRDALVKGNGWRHFALDQIGGPIVRIGTFTPREIPSEFENDDALGWISGGSRHEIRVWLSPRIAPSAGSRVWQRDQRIETNADGSLTMTFTVGDADEVIRWSFGFANEARIVAPPAAVARAAELARAIASAYTR